MVNELSNLCSDNKSMHQNGFTLPFDCNISSTAEPPAITIDDGLVIRIDQGDLAVGQNDFNNVVHAPPSFAPYAALFAHADLAIGGFVFLGGLVLAVVVFR